MTHPESSLQTAITEFVNDAIGTYLDKKWKGYKTGKEPKTEHILLDRIFPVERRIRSIIGGLETSLGTTFWEKLAKYVAETGGFDFKDTNSFQKPAAIPHGVSQLIQDWRAKREIPSANIGTKLYIQQLRSISNDIPRDTLKFNSISGGDGIDLWLLKNNREYIFDIKTVQLNAGNGNAFSRKVMEWYSYRILADPQVDVKVAMAFPYSPHKPFTIDSWWDKQGHKAYPLKRGDDAIVQGEFWDLLSGEENTWTKMLAIFESFRDSDFAEKYHDLFYPPQ